MSSMKDANLLTVAVATDDGKTYITRHFGDARGYDLYGITDTSVTFLKRLSNTTEEDAGEDVHGDAEKAKGIATILADHGVQITVSRVYGPNLKRIRKRFVCVIDQTGTIEQMLQGLQDMHAELIRQWSDSSERTLIRL